MTPLIAFLVYCQALGAVVGAITAVWSELAYVRAMRDGRVDGAERAHLDIIVHGLRYGLTLHLLASLGLVIVAYVEHNTLQPALTASYWTLIALALIIITVSWALYKKHIAFKLGSASVFTAWWFLVFLSFGFLPLTFGAAVMSFVVATAIFYALLYYARLLASPR
ncbi:MAG: hypothetical protein G01um101491_122 [Parcubacteria group bacterium Gr01-1014_91]|nr:MAG: hypothetical protein G01um101491_122 [Parcubacteria group bacterium Gr01-1014_91]